MTTGMPPSGLTGRQFQILELAAHYEVLNRPQLSAMTNIPDRTLRRQLLRLTKQEYLARHMIPVSGGSYTIPAYAPTKKTLHLLAVQRTDPRCLLKPTGLPEHIHHSLCITDTHRDLDLAIEAQPSSTVQLLGWYSERTAINLDVLDGAKRRTIAITIQQPDKKQMVSRPDVYFAIRYRDECCLYAMEEHRGTTWATKEFRRNIPPYLDLHRSNRHLEHLQDLFAPMPEHWRILYITPSVRKRDALRAELFRQLSKRDDVDDTFRDRWLFASKQGECALTAETFLFEPVFFRCYPDTEAEPLIFRSPTNLETAAGHVPGTPVQPGQAAGYVETI